MSRLRDARLSSSTMHFTPTRPKAVVQPFFNLHTDGHLSALRHDQVQGAGLRSTEDAQIAQIAPFAGTRKAVPYTGFQATDSRFCDNGCQKHCAPRTYDLACRSVVRIEGVRASVYLRSIRRFSLSRRVSVWLQRLVTVGEWVVRPLKRDGLDLCLSIAHLFRCFRLIFMKCSMYGIQSSLKNPKYKYNNKLSSSFKIPIN